MQPLIDGDVLRYEIGYAAETGWQQPGFPPFDYVAELLDSRIANICAIVEATAPPILYLTGPTNFRNEIAKRQKYKERPSLKPWHFNNITAYMKATYDVRVSVGMEADDCMAIEQTSRPEDTIICTRDKDLRQVPGWHYGWELGNQAQYGPRFVDEMGEISLSKDRKSIKGCGSLFFLSQMLTGDKVDTVPGLDGVGPVKALEILDGTNTYREGLKRVYEAYRQAYGLLAYKEMLEQGRLLWMVRKVRKDGTPVLWGQTS
jgi:5'-3' exonuclease